MALNGKSLEEEYRLENLKLEIGLLKLDIARIVKLFDDGIENWSEKFVRQVKTLNASTRQLRIIGCGGYANMKKLAQNRDVWISASNWLKD